MTPTSCNGRSVFNAARNRAPGETDFFFDKVLFTRPGIASQLCRTRQANLDIPVRRASARPGTNAGTSLARGEARPTHSSSLRAKKDSASLVCAQEVTVAKALFLEQSALYCN